MSRMTEYGLFDTMDDCWLGDNDAGTGPRTWPQREIARIACDVATTQFSYALGRLRVRVYKGDANKLKDEVTPLLSFDQAVIALGWQDEFPPISPASTPVRPNDELKDSSGAPLPRSPL